MGRLSGSCCGVLRAAKRLILRGLGGAGASLLAGAPEPDVSARLKPTGMLSLSASFTENFVPSAASYFSTRCQQSITHIRSTERLQPFPNTSWVQVNAQWHPFKSYSTGGKLKEHKPGYMGTK